jgi:anti-sigma factor RsiW
MPKPNDEKLIAYLDGELDERERADIAAALDHDGELRDRAQRLSESAALLRAAFDEVLREPLPDRLIAAARGETSKVVSIMARVRRGMAEQRRWWIGIPVAASLMGLMIGGGLGYFAGDEQGTTTAQAQGGTGSGSWLDSLAGYHKLFVNAGSNDAALADVPANAGDARKVSQKLPPDFRLPNLKPWGLVFQGARFLVVDGKSATQLFYTTDNKALGPLTVVVGSAASKPDMPPTFDRRDDLNMIYWRHHGHYYALIGTADIGYLWNISNDIAWQLDAI